MPIATALIQDRKASPQMGITAIKMALQKAGLKKADNVLVFLTGEFTPYLDKTLAAIQEAAGTDHVFGCTTVGVLTEHDWVIDGPAIAVMVFAAKQGLCCERKPEETFALVAPSAINTLWLEGLKACYGGVSGDFTGQGPYAVWNKGELQESGRLEASWKGLKTQWHVSLGLETLTPKLSVTGSDGLDLLTVDHTAAALPLWHALREENAIGYLPLVYALTDGEEPIPVLSVHLHNGRVNLARPLKLGQTIRWAIRTANAATQDINTILTEHQQSSPQAILMIASACRGATLHDGRDAELDLIKQRWPGLPIIGFYGNGEITPYAGKNRILSTSTLIGLLF